MDIPRILEHLGYADQDWGPLANEGDYAKVVSAWRGERPPPALEDVEVAWQSLQDDRSADIIQRKLELLQDPELLDAILEILPVPIRKKFLDRINTN